MQRITPHLWFDKQAREAADFYVATFPQSTITWSATLPDTPGGDTDIVAMELFGHAFMAISAGPLFSLNPSISFMVACDSARQVDELWARLSEGGSVLMPLDAYPFSERFGWTADRYGVSWQLSVAGENPGQRVTPSLLFTGDVCGRAEEAIGTWTALFPDSSTGEVQRYGAAEEPEREGTIRFAQFRLFGQDFAAMDSARDHGFAFNEAVSLMVYCDNQEEIDRYWALSAVPEAEQCGWIKDAFGVSWQIVPAGLDDMLVNGTPEQTAAVTRAFLPMKKFDLAELERAYREPEKKEAVK